MTAYEIDSAYVRKCHKKLKEWGTPLSDWYCDHIYDVADEDADADNIELFTCELCNCPQVRFVHVMRHEKYFEAIEVGCICAGIMEGDILAAKERERLMKNRAKRKRNFPNRHWKRNWHGNLYLTYQDTTVFINRRENNRYSVYVNGKTAYTYKGRPLDNFDAAAYAAFDLVDPVSEVGK